MIALFNTHEYKYNMMKQNKFKPSFKKKRKTKKKEKEKQNGIDHVPMYRSTDISSHNRPNHLTWPSIFMQDMTTFAKRKLRKEKKRNF